MEFIKDPIAFGKVHMITSFGFGARHSKGIHGREVGNTKQSSTGLRRDHVSFHDLAVSD